MKFKKLILPLLALLLIAAQLVSCSDGEAAKTGEITPPTAISADKQGDYTTDPTLKARVEELANSFENVTVNAEIDFEWSEVNGSATVTKYVGTNTKVRVPDTLGGLPVTTVGAGAFSEKTDLTALYLPDSITRIGKGILEGCKSLEALRTPLLGYSSAEKQYLGYLFTVATDAELADGAYPQKDHSGTVPGSLKYLELSVMTALPEYALFDCLNLECVKLPDALETIDTRAMQGCERLLCVNLDEVSVIGDYALAGCRSLTGLHLSAEVTSIGLGAFEGDGDLHRMTLPFVGGGTDETAYLGYIFGAEHPDFSRGYYPPYLVEINLLSGCTALGQNAFRECRSLTRITLPDTLTSIGLRAFDGCIRLSQITLPSSVTEIGENAFFNCHSLAVFNVEQDSLLQSIGINAFYNCVSLKNVTLPQSLNALPASCFAGCTGLESIDLGGVRTVGKNAFRGCKALKSVKSHADVTFDEGNEAATK